MTNEGQGVEAFNIKVGEPEIELALTGDTTLLEGTTGNLTLSVSPAEHGPFTVAISSVPLSGPLAGFDYTDPFTVNVPENDGSVACADRRTRRPRRRPGRGVPRSCSTRPFRATR